MKYTNENIKRKKIRREKNKKIITGLVYIIIFPIILFNLLIIFMTITNPYETPSFFGVKAFVIISGSMEPNLNIGDIVFMKEVDESDIYVDDIIAFRDEQSIVTHRVIGIVENDGKEFVTKGDNNSSKDSHNVTYEDIEGKYIGKIPYLGNIILFFKDKVVILIVILVFCLGYLYSVKIAKRKEKRRELREKYEKDKTNENNPDK